MAETKVIKRAPDPVVQPEYSKTAAFDAATETAFVTGRAEEFDYYRGQFERSGRINEWTAFETNFKYARDTDAKNRLVSRMRQDAKDSGIATPPEKLAGMVNSVVTASQQPARDTAAAAKAARTIVPNSNGDDIQQVAQKSTVVDDAIAAEVAGKDKAVKALAHRFADADSPYLGFAGVIGEGLLPTETPKWYWIADQIGAPKSLLAGEQMKNIGDYLNSLPTKEKYAKVQELINVIGRMPEAGRMSEYFTISSVLDPDTGTVNVSSMDRWLGNIGTVLDATVFFAPINGIVKWGKMAMRTKSIGRMATMMGKHNQQLLGRYMSELAVKLKDSEIARTYNISGDTIAMTQLPKPKLNLGREAVPDGVLESAERTAAIRGDITNIDARLRSNLFTPEEAMTAFERESKSISEAVGARQRPALSTATVSTSGDGIKFETVLGRTNEQGFVTHGAAQRYAKQFQDIGEDVSIMKVEDGMLVPVTGAEKGVGDFYVQLNQTYNLRPEDKSLFGFAPVASGSWLGRAGRWLLAPFAQFDPKIYNAYSQAITGEAAIAAKLDAIAAPIFRDLGAAERNALGSMWEWTEQFGTKQNRLPTQSELTAAFPDASVNQVKGWHQLRLYYDTVYDINNHRLFRDWQGHGFRTVRNGDSSYHGLPMANPDKSVTALDLATGEQRTLNRAEVNKLYDDGGNLMQLDTAVESMDGSTAHTVLLVEKGKGWKLKPLESNVLKYVPGYYPRIYKDFHFVQRVTKQMVDGVEQERVVGVAVGSSREEAQSFADSMTGKNTRKDTTYRVADDVRMSSKDRTAMDLDRLRTEGRLFFDTRNQQRLYNVNGNLADVIDPINMLNNTSRMVARQMSTEDLVKTLKSAWRETYGDLYHGNFETAASSAVDAELRSIASTAEAGLAKRAVEAQQLWDYVRLMEGSVTDTAIFKRRAIAAGEWINSKTRGIPGLRELGVGMARGAHNVAPVEWMKQLAYFTFLVTTPARQLILQSGQLSFIAPLLAFSKRPDYMFRWHLDTTALMYGTKRFSMAASGGKTVTNKMLHTNAKLMGLSVEEYTKLISEFELSGLLQSVNVHSFAGDIPPSRRVTAQTKTGRVADRVAGAVTARPVREGLEKYGFQLGEQFNLSGSYMAAVRLKMNETGKTIAQFTGDEWKAIGQKASDLALGMNRANSAKFQYGLISLPLQFLSFTHKTALTMMKAATFGKIGPRSWTVGDAWKVLAGQAILFGGAGFGVKPEVEDALAEIGVDNPEVTDIIAGGLLDILLDKSLQSVANDPDLDLAFDEFLAPGANIVNVIRKFYEAASETPIGETMAGPASEPLSGIVKAVGIASLVSAGSEIPGTPFEKVEMVSNAFMQGIAAGYSNYVKARAANQVGYWLTSGGDPTGVEAKWEEVVARGVLGLDNQARLDAMSIRSNLKDHEKMIRDTAMVYNDRATALINLWSDGKLSEKEFETRLAVEKAMLSGLDEEEKWAVVQEMNKLTSNRRGKTTGIEFTVAQALTKGVPPDKALRAKIARTPAITNEQDREAILHMIDTMMAEPTPQYAEESVDKDLEGIRKVGE